MTADRGWAYRPELDGIRGIAILLVVVAHAGVPGFEWGGQAGVTLFFVLSGYLITGLLVAEHARSGRIDLRAFYVRRARRLFPALAVFLVVSLAAGWARPDAIAAIALYVGNWYRIAGESLDFLSHAWSLAIEEQFYLVWPLLFMAGLRSPKILLALAALSGVYHVASGGSVSTFARADGLLLGCALALMGWVMPVVRLLAARPLVWFGGISYALYLWHFPLILATGWPVWFSVPASIVVAWASTRYVERPFRLRRHDAVADAESDVQPTGRARLGASDVELVMRRTVVH